MSLLTRRALNRALLARQHLIAPCDRSVPQVVEHLVGLQAQAPQAPYVGLWCRIAGFRPEQLSDLIASRVLVRAVLMRATIHLVTADDCLVLWPLLRPVLERNVYGNTTYGQHRLRELDVAAVLDAGRRLVEDRPRSASELRDLLGASWPDRDPAALAYAVRQLLPLVHVPPRGLWRASGQPRFTTVEAWLGRGVTAEPAVEVMVRRYLAAFGPATVADAQTWSGLTGLREVMENLPVATYRDADGRLLYDLPDAPRPDPDTPVPPVFLPEYDNLLVSYADRSRVLPDGYLKRVFNRGAFLLDGFVRGSWRIVRVRRAVTVDVTSFEPLVRTERAAVEERATELLRFAAPDAERHDVRLSNG